MKYKAIAILGIASYLFTVLTSVEDLEGNLLTSGWLIAASGIVKLAFTVLAILVLWKVAKRDSLIFLFAVVFNFGLAGIQQFILSESTLIIVLLNISAVIHFLVYFYIVFLLFQIKRIKKK